jgi:hypothetical protein
MTLKKIIFWVIVGMIALGTSVYGELRLRPIHRDEPVQYTLEQRFSMETALSGLEKMKASLESFRTITEEVKGKVSAKRLKEIGNTDWEIQHLGFKNFPGAIEGTLYKQDYMIKDLRNQLAKEKWKQKTISQKEMEEAQASFDEAEKAFQKFWDGFAIAN